MPTPTRANKLMYRSRTRLPIHANQRHTAVDGTRGPPGTSLVATTDNSGDNDAYLFLHVVSSLPQVLTPGPTCADELLHGRAGTLYLLRTMRHCVPDTAVLLDRSIQSLPTTILAAGPGCK